MATLKADCLCSAQRVSAIIQFCFVGLKSRGWTVLPHVAVSRSPLLKSVSFGVKSSPCRAVAHMVCALQASASEEDKKLQDLKEQVAAASRDADVTTAEAAQARKQLVMLQQAVSAAQHSMHSMQPSACLSMPTQHCQGSMQPIVHGAPDHTTPTRHCFTLWHEDRHRPPSDQSPAGNAVGRVTDNIYQPRCTGSPECISPHGGSPVRPTAGQWQYVLNSDTTHVCSAEHAQHACGALHIPEPACSALHGQLCSAEAEVAKLRAKMQAQHAGSSRDALQSSQVSCRDPVTPIKLGDQRTQDRFSAPWAQEREKDPFVNRTMHGGAAARAATSGQHAELASVSAQVAQQRSVLQQLTSQVLQVMP